MSYGLFVRGLNSALPPDVRRGSAPPLTPIKNPFARHSRAPDPLDYSYGGAEPRLTSGGRAEAE
jgi:hypothetical protein